jgi:hypothetical protein
MELRPWTLFAVMLSLGLAFSRVQGYFTWPQAIVLGFCFLLLSRRFVRNLERG